MKIAPRPIFEQILEWSVIPTFDLVIEVENRGFLMVKRKLSPYKNRWAFPGLRMQKGETINESLVRIARHELGIKVNYNMKLLLGQYVGKFQTENRRQDLSTGYYFKITTPDNININAEHYSAFRLCKRVPPNTGAMYKFYFNKASNIRN